MDLQVTEYEYHKYVFSPAHNIGMKYGKGEIVTIERLLSDYKANKVASANLRQLAHFITDIQKRKDKQYFPNAFNCIL